MVRTRDFLDEWAEWYALPESSTPAGPRAQALPSPFAPPLDIESLWSAVKRGSAGFLEAPLAWCERARQRRALRRMSDHMLDDIGISRTEALDEAAKPFWRA